MTNWFKNLTLNVRMEIEKPICVSVKYLCVWYYFNTCFNNDEIRGFLLLTTRILQVLFASAICIVSNSNVH